MTQSAGNGDITLVR